MKTKIKKAMSRGLSKGKILAVGGVAALSAISAGAYYLLGPDSKKHQKKASGLLNKIKKEANSELKKAKILTAPYVKKLVNKTRKSLKK